MQVCTSLQTDNHASTQPLSLLQYGCPSCRPTNSVKALKKYTAMSSNTKNKTKMNREIFCKSGSWLRGWRQRELEWRCGGIVLIYGMCVCKQHSCCSWSDSAGQSHRASAQTDRRIGIGEQTNEQ